MMSTFGGGGGGERYWIDYDKEGGGVKISKILMT